jgi:YVTN family beta-propeller protein
LTGRTTDLVEGELPSDVRLRPLGLFNVPDFERPEPLAELVIQGLPERSVLPRAERASRPRRRTPFVLAALVAAAAGGVASFFALAGEGSGPSSNIVVSIDPRGGSVDRRVAVGTSPTSIAVGDGGVWVLNAADATISELDPSGRVVRTLGTTGTPTNLATAGGSVWVANRPNVVLRIDPTTGITSKTIVLKTPGTAFGPFIWFAVGRGSLWVSIQQQLARIDLGTNLVQMTRLPPADWGPIAVTANGVWEAETQTLYHLDAAGRTVVGSLAFPQGPLVVAQEFVWALNPSLDVVAQIDPRTNTVTRTVSVGAGPAAIAFGAGRIWVASRDGTVSGIDPQTARVVTSVRVGGTPQGIAVGYGRVWVTVG